MAACAVGASATTAVSVWSAVVIASQPAARAAQSHPSPLGGSVLAGDGGHQLLGHDLPGGRERGAVRATHVDGTAGDGHVPAVVAVVVVTSAASSGSSPQPSIGSATQTTSAIHRHGRC